MKKFLIFTFWVIFFGGFIASIFFLPGENIKIGTQGKVFSFLRPLPEKKIVDMIFVGDIMLSRNVDKKMREYGDFK
ncbi:MAG: hypothetical protein V1841_00295, partial [Patescibacteria group bacterium]